MDEDDEREIHFNKLVGKTYFGGRFGDVSNGQAQRIASKVFDGGDSVMEIKIGSQSVVRTTPRARHLIKATFYEDGRNISVLTLQKYNSRSGPKEHFSFVGQEIPKILQFIANIQQVQFKDDSSLNLTDSELKQIVLNSSQTRQVFKDHEEEFLALAQNETLTRDLIAVGYRREQLKHFEKLLSDPDYFETERTAANKTPEAVWQAFFEKNSWIFGYGLSYIFLDGLEGRKLEQVTTGHNISNPGKRADALLKTRAAISALCFVEIKRHDSPLLFNKEYRPGVWHPSSELVGGLTQLQATVNSALEVLGRKLSPTDDDGNPTGETLFNFAPRSFLVIGSLNQFKTETGINETKYRSFELFRRNISQPEVLTFDELLHRAKYIVEHS